MHDGRDGWKADAMSFRLVGERGDKGLRHERGSHTASGVGDLQNGLRPKFIPARRVDARTNDEDSTIGHGISRIGDEVRERVADLRHGRVDLHVLARLNNEADATRSQGIIEDLGYIEGERAEIQSTGAVGSHVGAHQLANALNRFIGLVLSLDAVGGFELVLTERGHGCHEWYQEVVDAMRQPSHVDHEPKPVWRCRCRTDTHVGRIDEEGCWFRV